MISENSRKIENVNKFQCSFLETIINMFFVALNISTNIILEYVQQSCEISLDLKACIHNYAKM